MEQRESDHMDDINNQYALLKSMIDLHCHILPGLDDGAASLEDSLAMAGLAVADGIKGIVATPHTLNGVSTNGVSDILSAVSDLERALAGGGISLWIFPGSEAHLVTRMALKIKNP